jgi:hypothetical protein
MGIMRSRLSAPLAALLLGLCGCNESTTRTAPPDLSLGGTSADAVLFAAAEPVPYGTIEIPRAEQALVGDLDGDGRDDLVVRADARLVRSGKLLMARGERLT